jgi:peptidoglycan glycosyltransferase
LKRKTTEDRLIAEELKRQKEKEHYKSLKMVDKKKYKEELKRERQLNKEKKKENNELRRTMAFFSVVFIVMIGYYCYDLYQAESIVNNSYNKRLKAYSEKIIRGNILTGDGKIIATTETDENGEDVRKYPYNEMFAHVVGMNTRGKTGLEKAYDYNLLTTNLNPVLKALNEFKEQKSPGNNITTTLDYKIQKYCYDSLGNSDGAVVIIDNKTGAIVSMVSKPDYNPNKLDSMWDKIDKGKVKDGFLLNRATQGMYTPGSTFKIFTSLEYIRQNPDYKDFTYKCTGTKVFANYPIKCYEKTAHGNEDIEKAFANSCNGFFATLGTKLDITEFSTDMTECLFNSKLPINIEYNKSKFTLTKDSSTFDITQSSIGQGTTLVTPLHMAMIANAISNDGMMMKPYLVSKITGCNDSLIDSFGPEKYKRIMTKEESATLKELMSAVTDYGTGRIFKSAKYKTGGKTGTAQIDSNNNVNSWYVGYASDDEHDYSISVVIENVPDGSVKAVECAKKIFDNIF